MNVVYTETKMKSSSNQISKIFFKQRVFLFKFYVFFNFSTNRLVNQQSIVSLHNVAKKSEKFNKQIFCKATYHQMTIFSHHTQRNEKCCKQKI